MWLEGVTVGQAAIDGGKGGLSIEHKQQSNGEKNKRESRILQ
jgi:hypothetical protein